MGKHSPQMITITQTLYLYPNSMWLSPASTAVLPKRPESRIIEPMIGATRADMDSVISVNGVPIRLTAERWFHIVENHDEVAGYYDAVLETVADPDLIVVGYRGSLVAVRGYGRRRYLSVIY